MNPFLTCNPNPSPLLKSPSSFPSFQNLQTFQNFSSLPTMSNSPNFSSPTNLNAFSSPHYQQQSPPNLPIMNNSRPSYNMPVYANRANIPQRFPPQGPINEQFPNQLLQNLNNSSNLNTELTSQLNNLIMTWKLQSNLQAEIYRINCLSSLKCNNNSAQSWLLCKALHQGSQAQRL